MKIIREFAPTDRYVYDFGPCSSKNGFAQLDTAQDASYYGMWANPEKRIIVSYCEGDVTTTICDNDKEFVEEIDRIADFNNSNGLDFKGIDPGFNDALKERFVSIGLSHYLH